MKKIVLGAWFSVLSFLVHGLWSMVYSPLYAQPTQFYLEDHLNDGVQARIYLIALPQARPQVQEALYASVDHARQAQDTIQRELADIQQKGAGSFMVSAELAQAMSAGVELSKKTNGQFNIASQGDYRKIKVNPKSNTLKLNDTNIQIGVDAILKGFLADLIADDLVRAGWPNVLVKVENVYVTRGNDANAPWRIPVVVPSEKIAKRVLYYQAKKESAAGATWTAKQDATTASDLNSVTVFSHRGIDSAGLAPAVLKMGSVEGKKFLARNKSLSAILVDHQGNLTNVR